MSMATPHGGVVVPKKIGSDQFLSALTLAYGTSDLVLTIKPLADLI